MQRLRRRGVWRMGISPCSNLVTATSPGQAPLPSPPSKCKLTADKAYGASPALRASVFIHRHPFPCLDITQDAHASDLERRGSAWGATRPPHGGRVRPGPIASRQKSMLDSTITKGGKRCQPLSCFSSEEKRPCTTVI